MNEPKPDKAEAEAFLEKLKTLTFGTGAKGPVCPSCGKVQHFSGVLVRFRMERGRKPPEQTSLAE